MRVSNRRVIRWPIRSIVIGIRVTIATSPQSTSSKSAPSSNDWHCLFLHDMGIFFFYSIIKIKPYKQHELHLQRLPPCRRPCFGCRCSCFVCCNIFRILKKALSFFYSQYNKTFMRQSLYLIVLALSAIALAILYSWAQYKFMDAEGDGTAIPPMGSYSDTMADASDVPHHTAGCSRGNGIYTKPQCYFKTFNDRCDKGGCNDVAWAMCTNRKYYHPLKPQETYGQ